MAFGVEDASVDLDGHRLGFRIFTALGKAKSANFDVQKSILAQPFAMKFTPSDGNPMDSALGLPVLRCFFFRRPLRDFWSGRKQYLHRR